MRDHARGNPQAQRGVLRIGATQMIVFPLILFIFLLAAGLFAVSVSRSRQPDVANRSEGLPGCESRPVTHELRDTYGKQISTIQSLVPSDTVAALFFDLRRAKQTSYDPVAEKRLCAGEYNSLLGLGRLIYQIGWFDPDDSTDGRVEVRIVDINSPENVRLVKNMLNKTATAPAVHFARGRAPES
jgi:hypothetical protein